MTSGLRNVAVAYDCLFPYTTGGGERQYRAFAEEIARHGIDVDYLTSRWAPDMAASDFRVVAASGPLRMYDAQGVRRPRAAVAFAFGLFRSLLLRRNRYDALIVSGLPVLNVFAARLALWRSRTVVVVDYLEVWGRHQWVEYAGRRTGSIAWALQRLAIAFTPVATCHSQLSARRLRAEGLRGPMLVSPGLITGDSGVSATLTGATPPYVLYVGRHIPDKRVESLPAAVAEARKSVPDLGLVVLGEGPTSDSVDLAIVEAGGVAWTQRPGFVSQEHLDALMSGAACLINPSRREGYGLVVVEAAAHGTPVVVVADDGNASTELVEPGVNGFIASSTAPAALASSIVRAIERGGPLRASTRAWYDEALTTRTIGRTVDDILAALARDETSELNDRRTGRRHRKDADD